MEKADKQSDGPFQNQLGVGQHPADSLLVGLVHSSSLAQTTLPLGIFLGQDMPEVLPAALEFATSGGHKTLCGTPSGLNLGHEVLLRILSGKAGEIFETRSRQESSLLDRGKHHGHGASLAHRLAFHLGDVLGVFLNSFKHHESTVLVHDFPSAEKHGYLAAISALKEPANMLELRLVIMIIRLGTKLDFLDLDYGLFLLRLLLAFLLLILELTVVHDLANGRISIGCDLNKVQSFFLGYPQGFAGIQNAQLLTVVVNNPYLRNSDPFVAPNAVIPPTAGTVMSSKSYSSFLRV